MTTTFPIGVCSWSIDRHDPDRAIAEAGEMGFSHIQIGFFSREAVIKADPRGLAARALSANVAICGTFVAFEGEDYSSIDSIRVTGGLMPDAAYENRLDTFRNAVAITAELPSNGVRLTAIHVGTIPEQVDSPDYANLINRTREFADVAAKAKVRLLLETGRESAATLASFRSALERNIVAINFDPANFVVYGTDDPVKAVSNLQPHIELVHLKDAMAAASDPPAFGSPAPFGQGEVQVPRVLSKLRATGYSGPLLLEIPQRLGPVALSDAASYLRTLL